MPNVCYFEIPVEDMSRAQGFYTNLFEWRFEKMTGPSAEYDYWSIETGTPNELGVAFGGMMKKQAPAHSVTQYINVDSIDAYFQKVQQLGGTPLVPKTAVPGKGYFAICLDLDHNPFGLWQCDASAS